MINEELESIAVRIEEKGSGQYLGSGTLCISDYKSKYAYIVTAAHVIYEKDFIVRAYCNNNENGQIIKSNIHIKNTKFHPEYDPTLDIKVKDVVVICVEKEEWMNLLPRTILGQPTKYGSILGRGFPDGTEEQIFKLAGQELEGCIGNISKEAHRFHLKLHMDIDNGNRDEELKGYSGTGLFNTDKDENDLILLGVFSYGEGINAKNSITNVFDSELVQEIILQNGWEPFGITTDAPLSFEPFIELAVSRIETDIVRNELLVKAEDEICTKISPDKLSTKYHDIPICIGNRMRCEKYWTSILQLLSILSIVGVDVKDFNEPYISLEKNGDMIRVPIEFICSEGHEGKCQMGAFIRSLLYSDYAWGNKLRENGLIIWSSKDIPTKMKRNSTEISRIVANICQDRKDKEVVRRRLHIKYGEVIQNKFSIMHIHNLISDLDSYEEDDYEDIIKYIKKVLSDAID